MQERESIREDGTPLERLLARTDDRAVDYITDELLHDGSFDDPPEPGTTESAPAIVEAG